MKTLIFALTLTLTLLSLNARADVHKWVDADGNVHYSDTLPNDGTLARGIGNVTGQDAASAPAGFVPKSLAEQEAALRKAKLDKDAAAKKQAEVDQQAAIRKNNCSAARENVRTLQDSPRIATYDANGDRSIMDDTERASKLQEAQKAVSDNCN